MTNPKFNPTKFMALCCKTEIQSKHPGQYVECFCGDAFVDENEYYVRCGGNVEPVNKPNPPELFGEDKED